MSYNDFLWCVCKYTLFPAAIMTGLLAFANLIKWMAKDLFFGERKW